MCEGEWLAEACLGAGVHYLDIGNELQVFRTLYDLHQRAQQRDPVTGRGRQQLGRAGVSDHLAAANDHQVIGCVLQFAHQVAGHQHRPALGGSDRKNPRIHTIPSGSMPLNGSSSISAGGSPSSAATMPSRCRIPSE